MLTTNESVSVARALHERAFAHQERKVPPRVAAASPAPAIVSYEL